MIALSVAFCLGGLAVLHAAARRLSHPTMVLVFFYTTAALFGWPFLVVAVWVCSISGSGCAAASPRKE